MNIEASIRRYQSPHVIEARKATISTLRSSLRTNSARGQM
jgi:hypothetical protein